MISNNTDIFESKFKLNTSKICQDRTAVYINKVKSSITKDRIAASLISDKLLSYEEEFSHTLINAFDRNKNCEITFTTTISLKYESLIAFIYALRINNIQIISIKNVVKNQYEQFIQVDGLQNLKDNIRIELEDSKLALLDEVIKEHAIRASEHHVSRVVKIYSNNDVSNYIQIALKKTFEKLGYFQVDAEGSYYTIFEGENIVCILHDKQLVFVSIQGKIKIDQFMRKLEEEFMLNGEALNAVETKDIIMF